jgi:N-acetylmuramoyl-L-alanine amidase
VSKGRILQKWPRNDASSRQKKGVEERVKKRNRLLVFVLLFSLLFSLAAFAEEGRFVKVTAYDVNIRAGAGPETAVIGTADFGDSFEVLGTENDWYRIKFGDGSGWIHASLVKEGTRFSSANQTIEVVEAKEWGVNVRGGASTSYEVVATIGPGSTYPLLQRSGDWVQIRLPDERTGWAASWLVTVSEDKAKTAAKQEQLHATVVADTLNVRREASLSAQVIGTIAQHETVPVIKQSGEWTEIEFQGGTGYVSTEYLRLPGQPVMEAKTPSPAEREVDPQTPVLTLSEQANLRTGPGTNFPVLLTGSPGSRFTIAGKSGAWYQIELEGGRKAWVAGWLAQVEGSPALVPETGVSLDSGLREKTIVLDAGHGGIDVGAVGRQTGVFEKDLNLRLTQMLYHKLVTTGARVVLTRPDDRFVSLQERVDIAVAEQADLFVSLHYNTHDDPALSGSMTFYYSEGGEDHKLAERVQQELVASLGLPDLGARHGDYYVLRENPVTAVLVETAFLTNTKDELATLDPAHQEKAAEGVFRAIVGYLQEK